MRNINAFFGFILLLFVFGSANAQNTDPQQVKKDSLLNKITNITNRLQEYSSKDTTKGFSAPMQIDTAYANMMHGLNPYSLRDEKGLLRFDYDWTPFANNISFRDTVIFEPAYLPVVFDGQILPADLDFRTKQSDDSTFRFHLISPDSTFAPQLSKTKQIQSIRRYYYTNNPQKIKSNALAFENTPVITQEVVERKSPWKEFISADNPIEISAPEVEKTKIKYLKWIKELKGDHKLQVSYNRFSKQWGGDDNFDLFSDQKFYLNFKKKKLEFNNLIEWRLQLKQITSVDDSDKPENQNKDKINIIEDYLRTYSTFSIQAFKKWSYSTNLEMKTPVLNKRATDEHRTRQRQFLTPFELNLGVGMRYSTENISKKNKNRKFNLAADLSILSVNHKYVRSDKIKGTNFGIEEGDKRKTDLGSTYNVNMSYAHNKFTKFNSRLKYFTNYERAYAEWENSVDFALNRYLATTVYFYLKYDDSMSPEKKNDNKGWDYFNYNTMLRFGLTYTW
ncbi:MAG: DUF3078 domain-containing protein [Dysgonomonas sp.]|nr:DUF3078 domain-containing protein [Dysgonomonas sp.]